MPSRGFRWDGEQNPTDQTGRKYRKYSVRKNNMPQNLKLSSFFKFLNGFLCKTPTFLLK